MFTYIRNVWGSFIKGLVKDCKSKGPITINISEKDDYYTQRNNEIKPHSACNVTSAVNWLASAKVKFYYDRKMQPEDYIMQLLMSDEGYEKMEEIAPWAVGRDPPNEVFVMLEWAINEVAAKNICRIKWNATIEDIVFSIVVKKKPVIVSGKFTEYGHFVTVVGLITNQGDIMKVKKVEDILLHKIKYIIIDDPNGDPNTAYRIQNGNDIDLSVDDFMKIIREPGENKKIGFFHKEALN